LIGTPWGRRNEGASLFVVSLFKPLVKPDAGDDHAPGHYLLYPGVRFVAAWICIFAILELTLVLARMGAQGIQMKNAYELAISSHPRVFEKNRYVYPVISRRSRGLSVGVNLNPDKICNFDCIYCQVDRTIAPLYREVDLAILENELRALLEDAQSGILFNHPNFKEIPQALKRINDIAFSGDGEPTTCPQFGEVVHLSAEIRTALNLPHVKLVAISNATRFHRPDVQAALAEMHRSNGEIWAKLDAGTADYYDRVERTKISFDRVVANLHLAAQRWPIVIQSLFMRIRGEAPSRTEIDAYCDVLRDIRQKGGLLKAVQVYTVARQPAESFVSPLEREEVDRIAAQVTRVLSDVPVEAYYGT
jgi:wyosine [tRNA(Phe)-imidazoG37] synthetase (radical SAM superfamily)